MVLWLSLSGAFFGRRFIIGAAAHSLACGTSRLCLLMGGWFRRGKVRRRSALRTLETLLVQRFNDGMLLIYCRRASPHNALGRFGRRARVGGVGATLLAGAGGSGGRRGC